MKVLILHQHFNTPHRGGALRSYYLAKALLKKGIHVEVLTAHHGKKKTEIVEGITIHYLPVSYKNEFGFLRRSMAFLQFLILSAIQTRIITSVDLCYAISVPLTVGLPAVYIKKRYGIPFLFEVGDLWPDVPIQMGFIKNYFFKRMLWKLEKYIYKSARAVIALSPPIQQAVEKKVPGMQVYVIPNMADTTFYSYSAKNPILEKKYEVQGKFVISYMGTLGLANGLDHFIACADASRKAGLNIQFILCGKGAMKKKLVHRARRLALTNLLFLDYTDRVGIGELMQVTDAVFVGYEPISILATGSPHKFFDGLAAGKLIIINFGGWIRDEIERHRCGIYVPPHHTEEFIGKIKPFLTDASLLSKYQSASRDRAEKKYSLERITAAFSNIVATQGASGF